MASPHLLHPAHGPTPRAQVLIENFERLRDNGGLLPCVMRQCVGLGLRHETRCSGTWARQSRIGLTAVATDVARDAWQADGTAHDDCIPETVEAALREWIEASWINDGVFSRDPEQIVRPAKARPHQRPRQHEYARELVNTRSRWWADEGCGMREEWLTSSR